MRNATLADLKRKKPRTERVLVPLDDEVAGRYDELRQRIAQIEKYGDDHAKAEVPALIAQVDQVEQELRDSPDGVVVVRFESRGKDFLDELLEAPEHQPTAKQIAEAKKAGLDQPAYNRDTFPIALIAATALLDDGNGNDVRMSEDDVRDLLKTAGWNNAEASGLFTAAWDVSSYRRVIDLGKG